MENQEKLCCFGPLAEFGIPRPLDGQALSLGPLGSFCLFEAFWGLWSFERGSAHTSHNEFYESVF